MAADADGILRVESPSRLHFGLLAFGDRRPRGFGGIGLMVQKPGLRLHAYRSDRPAVLGDVSPSLHRRVEQVLEAIHGRLPEPIPITIEFHSVPEEHAGLGTGTQLSLCIAKAVSLLAGLDPPTRDLAVWTGRGRRSAIGVHGFDHGGLLADGGKSSHSAVAPLLARIDFPSWPILLIRPRLPVGMHGPDEQQAMADHPPIPQAKEDRLARLLWDMLAAAADQDYHPFSEALYQYNRLVGECFAFAQGGRYAHPVLEQIVAHLRERGVEAVGQSSWGPTLFAICPDDRLAADARDGLLSRWRPEELDVVWAHACNRGALVERIQIGDA